MDANPAERACRACDRDDYRVGVSAPQVVVVDHYDSYTWNLVHLIASVTGELPQVVEHDRTSLAELAAYSHVVLSPRPGHPGDPGHFVIGRALIPSAGVPVLGVCLGMQGMVTAYGGTVERVRPAHGEIATVTHDGTRMFAGVPDGFAVVRYHSLAATQVPRELEVVAWCEDEDGSRVVMGVAHRERPQWGVQFHPESILTDHGARLVANFLELS